MSFRLAIEVPGEPVPKARARIRVLAGKVSSYTPKGTAIAEQTIGQYAKAAGARLRGDVDFALACEFRIGSWQRRDVDNLAKLVMDALTGIVWADDSQVRLLTAQLDRGATLPGTSIVISELPAQRQGVACERCGTFVRSSPSSRRRFCSIACQGEYRTAHRLPKPTPNSGLPAGRRALAERTPLRDYSRMSKRRERARP